MNYRQLINAARIHLSQYPGCVATTAPGSLFTSGGRWMQQKLCELRGTDAPAAQPIAFTAYGILKYGLSLAAFFAAAVALGTVSYWLAPLAVIVFYIVEAHFLFLFPLLMDNSPKPVWASIRLTYKVGLARAVVTVMPIGFFMVAGLLNFNNPFRCWHIGCMAVVIWYEDETRDRL